MKTIGKLCIAILFLTVAIACKDTKEVDEAAVKAAIEEVEAVESEIDSVTKELNKEAAELEDSLKDLDEI